MEYVFAVVVVASVGDVGDLGDSERHVRERGGVLLLVVGDASSVWISASRTCCSDVTYGIRGKKFKT